MNSHDDELARLLGDGLRAQAEHGIGAEEPITLAGVQRRARRITRNRRLGAIAAAAVVAGIVGPTVAVLANGNPRSAQPPVTNVSPSPKNDDSTVPSPSPSRPVEAGDYQAGRPILLADLGQGGPPAIGWAEAAQEPDGTVGTITLHPPVGAPFATPRGQLYGLTPLGGGWALSMWRDQRPEFQLSMVGADGVPIETKETGTPPVLSARGSAAWLGATGSAPGELEVHVREGEVSYDLGALPAATGGYELSGISGSCANGDCAVFALAPREQVTRRIDQDGTILELPQGREVTSVGREHFTAVISTTDEGSCSGVFSLSDPAGDPLWQTCDYTLDHISPNDDYVLGLPAYLDGLGPGTVDVLDLKTGSKVAGWPASRNSVTFARFAWESDSSFLTTIWSADRTAILRLSTDGGAELAVPPVQDPNLLGRYLLETS